MWTELYQDKLPKMSLTVEEDGGQESFISRWKYKLKEVFTWRLLKTLAMGQCLSALICGTGLSSLYLTTDYKVNTPMLQNFINYALLGLVYNTVLAFRKGDDNLLPILKTTWWRYFLLALADVEANYLLVTAYQFTTLTSVQLLDCFVIPVVMLLSWFILKTRYKPVHYVAVIICLVGVGAMVGADLLAGRDQGSSSNLLLGDGLVLISAVLYGISNVCQEYAAKHHSMQEFPAMVGLFGTLIGGIQCTLLEFKPIAEIQWNWKIVMLFASFALCMFALYSLMPVVMRATSATAVNLSLLTADFFSFFTGLFLLQYAFSGLYVVSFVAIIVGFAMFNTVPPALTPSSERTTDSPGTNATCLLPSTDNRPQVEQSTKM